MSSNSQKKMHAAQASSADSGSFSMGLLLGAAAGAAGVFLLQTERGKRIREELAMEWEEARAHLLTKGTDGAYDIPPTLREAGLEAYEAFKAALLHDAPRRKGDTSSEERSPKKDASPQKFRGV